MADGQLGLVLRHFRQWIGARAAPAEGTDAELLERFVLRREETAFATLAQRHAALVWGVCRRVLRDVHAAEDAFQATFVILARKAGSISKRESLGSWLYGVAYRVAVRARVNASRRQEREKGVDDMRHAESAADANRDADPAARVAWQEACSVLDEELNRLPEKYRVPLVLCYLRGKTNEEAAGELNCPAGSMSWRLAQAREQLRAQLARRGVALSAAGLAAFLAEGTASARVPAPLVQTTIQTALNSAAGATGLSAGVAALVEGVMKAMWISKLKTAAVVVVLVGLIGSGVGVLAYRSLGNDNGAGQSATGAKKEEPAAGPVVNGLKLSLTADKTETVMKADGSNAEPVKLKLTFTNVSDKPIKFDAYDFWWSRIKGALTPPSEDSVRVARLAVDRVPIAPRAVDFVEIKAGQSWSFDQALAFPGRLPQGGDMAALYTVLKPGQFKVKFTYNNSRQKIDADFAKGAWSGELVSNELTITVKAADKKADAGPALNGLQLTLSADKTETFMKADGSNAEPVKLKLTFTNVSDKPIKLNAYDFGWSRIQTEVTAPDGDSLRALSFAASRASAPVHNVADFPEIPPGKTWDYEKELGFPGSLPRGASSFTSYSVLKPGKFRIQCTYTSNEIANPLAKGAWTGQLASNELTITVKAAR